MDRDGEKLLALERTFEKSDKAVEPWREQIAEPSKVDIDMHHHPHLIYGDRYLRAIDVLPSTAFDCSGCMDTGTSIAVCVY